MGLLKGGGASDDRLDAKTGENQTTVMDAMDSGGSGTTTADGGSTEVRYGELNESGDADQQQTQEQATEALREQGVVVGGRLAPGETARPLGTTAAETTPIANVSRETITLAGPRPIERAKETGVLQTTEGPIPLSSPRIQWGVPEVRLHNRGFFGSFEEATAAGFENIPESANVRTGSEEATGGGVPPSQATIGNPPGGGGGPSATGAGGEPPEDGGGGGGGLSGLAIAGVLGLAAVAFGVIGS